MSKQDYINRKHEPLVLRVRQGGEVDKLIRTLVEEDRSVSEAEMKSLGIWTRTGYLPRWLDEWFDNIRVETNWGDQSRAVRMHYHYINPAAPISIGGAAVAKAITASTPDEPEQDIERLLWPQSPPIIQSMGETFRTPTYFKTMREMVRKGRHIALSGPPGVGKDTAVQELASNEGIPLVTIGGDAGFRKRDLVGSMQIAKGQSFLEVAEYAAAVVFGWWVLLTEVNAADADALMFVNTQLAPPNIITIGGKAYPVHPDFRLFITYNPGLTGTKPLPQSFKDRFFPIQVPFFTKLQLTSILTAHGMPSGRSWGNSIVEYGMKLWDAHERGQLRYQVTSRRLMDAVELVMSDLVSTVSDAIKAAVIAGIDSPIEQKVALQVLNQIGGSVFQTLEDADFIGVDQASGPDQTVYIESANWRENHG